MTATRAETITATAETLDATLARITANNGRLEAMDATGDAYTLTVAWPATDAPASGTSQEQPQAQPCMA